MPQNADLGGHLDLSLTASWISQGSLLRGKRESGRTCGRIRRHAEVKSLQALEIKYVYIINLEMFSKYS